MKKLCLIFLPLLLLFFCACSNETVATEEGSLFIDSNNVSITVEGQKINFIKSKADLRLLNSAGPGEYKITVISISMGDKAPYSLNLKNNGGTVKILNSSKDSRVIIDFPCSIQLEIQNQPWNKFDVQGSSSDVPKCTITLQVEKK